MKRTAWLLVGTGLLIAVALGCGDDSTAVDSGGTDSGGVDTGTDTGGVDSGEDAGDDDAGEDAATDASGSDATVPPGPCPETRPDANAECTDEGLVCEYGARICLSSAECIDGEWLVAIPRCPPPPTGGCPETREDAEGQACAGDEGARCEYDPGLICHCTTCPDPYPVCVEVDPPVWACEPPNPDETCPVAQPLLGTGCATEEQICDYGCEAGERRICSDGGWISGSQPGGCPRSSRRVKRDIDYLDGAAVDEVARQVLETRLASYEYTDPALRGRRHLGFIIEDQAPAAYSVDPERSQVDLYGYTSMLLATVQAQERRIVAMERELATLRACRPD